MCGTLLIVAHDTAGGTARQATTSPSRAPDEFRAGWFAESLATQTLVVFAIRTRRKRFTRSRPSLPLLVAALVTVAVGAMLPLTPLADVLGLAHLPPGFYGALAAMVAAYMALIEVAKRVDFATAEVRVHLPRRRTRQHRVHRRAARFSVPGPLAGKPPAGQPPPAG